MKSKNKNIKCRNQKIIMVEAIKLQSFFLRVLAGLLVYFAIVNTIIAYQQGNLYTPIDWLVNPIFNLFTKPSGLAWIIFGISLIIGWYLFEIKGD